MVEFKKGDIAYLNRRKRVKLILGNEYKSETIQTETAVEIMRVHRSQDEIAKQITGGAVYDVKFNGYEVECIPQKDLYSKAQWETITKIKAAMLNK